MPRPDDWFEKFAKTVLVGWIGAICLIEEPSWCPSEGQCVRPVVTTEEVDRHKNSCRKEGAR